MLSFLREGPEAWVQDPELLQSPYVTTDKSLPPGLSSFSLEMDYMTFKLAFVLYFLLVLVNAHTHIPQHMYKYQNTFLWSQFSPIFMYILGFELRALGLCNECFYLLTYLTSSPKLSYRVSVLFFLKKSIYLSSI